MRESHPSAGRIQVGIRRLLDHHPLLGGLVASWHLRLGRIGTMGVSWDDDGGIVLTYDPDFVMTLTFPELEDVLIHEVRHVIYGHCFMDPEEWPDRKALLIAQEVTVNEGLEHLPGKPVVLDDYPQLQPNTDTRERYAVLAVDQHKDNASQDGADHQRADDGKSSHAGDDADGDMSNDQSDCESDGNENPGRTGIGVSSPRGVKAGAGAIGIGNDTEDDDTGDADEDGATTSCGSTMGNADGATQAGDGSCPGSHDGASGGSQRGSDADAHAQVDSASIDMSAIAVASTTRSKGSNGGIDSGPNSHEGWQGIREHRDEVLADVRAIIRELMQAERSLCDDELELERIGEASGPMPFGCNPAGGISDINAEPRDVSPHQLRQVLVRLMGSGRDRAARFDRPPRRCPELIGVIPALARSRMRVRALAVIDTSGSIDNRSLASMATILRMIEDAAEWTVVECDAAIHRVYPFSGTLRTVMGGGGTDFRPPLATAFLARTCAEAVVYLTDGYGPVPDIAPQVPVIWALTHNGEPPCDWGKVLRLEEK